VADPLTIASFCSGVGMLDEAVALALRWFGYGSCVVCYCERDAYAAACLLARMEDASLECAPVFCGDLADFDGRRFAGCVDIVAAGLPCQPYSCAGKQLGLDDERSWSSERSVLPQFLRIVGECRPAVVLLENVPAWVTGGWFRPFGDELCRLGYALAEPLFARAAAVGASHQRERVFLLAYDPRARMWELPNAARRPAATDVVGRDSSMGDAASGRADAGEQRGRLPSAEPAGRRVGNAQRDGGRVDQPRRRSERRAAAAGSSEVVEHADLERREAGNIALHREGTGAVEGQTERAQQGCSALGDAECSGQRIGWRDAAEIAYEGCAPSFAPPLFFAPGPRSELWGAVVAHAPQFRPAIEPGFRVLVDGVAYVVDASRADQLRCGGNGVVALAGACAVVELLRREFPELKRGGGLDG
jgi:DNA (cytosine-5)-methyltransferase 1